MKNTLSTCKYFINFIFRTRKIYFGFLILNILFLALAPFPNILFPKYLITELMGQRRIFTLALYVGILVIANFVFSFCLKVVVEMRTKYEDKFSRILDERISAKTMNMSYEYTEKSEVIEAEKKAETGMSWYSGGIRGLMDCIVNITAAVVTFFGVLYIIYSISIWVILLTVISVVINTVVTSQCNKAQQEVFKITPKINKFYYYVYQKLTERRYAKDIRLYDGSNLICKKEKDNADSLNRIDNSCARKQTRWGTMGVIVASISGGISYCLLGALVIKGKITVGELVAGIAALEIFSNQCLTQIIRNVQEIFLKCNFMSAFVKYMQYEDARENTEQKEQIDEFKSLDFENVTFSYPGMDHPVLENISFHIDAGERVSIVGLNGAGKTTIVKLICRLYKVNDGDIKINGKSIYDYDYESYLEKLSVVFQDFKLFGYSLDKNISFGNPEKELEKPFIYQMSGIEEWVEAIPQKGNTIIGKEFDTNGIEPSGGIAQKIAIARALHRDAPIVILDEPTAALDPVAEYEIYNKFNDLIKNKTAFYISHRLSSCKFCSRIIVLDNNHIVEDGDHDQLLKLNGLYAKMYNTQAQWYSST